jgi:O-methyltransferase involved in polyketide biosynthesis
MAGSTAISPTAHYTGYVWARNGLSPRELSTIEGRLLFESLHPLLAVSAALGGPSLESYLLARHRAIDALLTRAIEDHGVTQVIELAAGMSARGWRFTERYGDRIEYVEADLAEMAARKRRALDRLGSLSERHRVREVDALRAAGTTSLAALAANLDARRGLAIITEGLLGYLPTDVMEDLWRRIAGALAGFTHGRYISDLHLGGVQTPAVRAFALLLAAFVRGRVHLHFSGPEQARAALLAAGFSSAAVHPALSVTGGGGGRGAALAHILEASTD